MLVTKASLTLSDVKFGERLTSKNRFFASAVPKAAVKQFAVAFGQKLSLIYAFPVALIKRNILLSHKTDVYNITNNQTSTNIYTQFAALQQQMLSVNEFFSTHSSKSLMPLPINALDKNLTPKKLITPWSESRAGKLTPQKFASHSLVTHTITQLQKIVYSKYSPEQSSQILEKPQTTVEIKTAITNQASDTDRLQILANQLRIHSLNHTEQNRSYPELPAFQVLRASEDSKTLGERQSFDSYEHAQMRHFISSQPQITREQIKQKEYEPNPSPLKTEEKPAVTDLNSVAEKVYQLIERKARIERERRG